MNCVENKQYEVFPFEPGACAGGFTEAAINLQLALKLQRILQRNGYDVFLTREDNVDNNGLTWRAEKAWEFGADIFVSIYSNSFKDPEAHGSEVLCYITSESGRRLAKFIPAALVKIAFISNDKERKALTDHFLQRQFAVAIAQGIGDYFEAGKFPGSVREQYGEYKAG